MAVNPSDLHLLSAAQAAELIRKDQLSVQEYARALLARVKRRDQAVRAWVFLDADLVLEQAKILDQIPRDKRGPLHGVAVGIKDIFLTKDMPTKYFSRLHTEDGNAAADSDAVTVLRAAGALIFGKTATTEYAAMTEGSPCANPHNPKHTPGGSSSGSAAAVADFQVPIAIGTQTGGSIVRPGSFNGIYGFKPTWASVSTEGASRFSVSCDSVGFYARTVEDLYLLARLYELDPHATIPPPLLPLAGAQVAFCKTHRWHYAGPGTHIVWEAARKMLLDQGATVIDLEMPAEFAKSQEWREVIVNEEARAAFLPKYNQDRTKLHRDMVSIVKDTKSWSRNAILEAHDGIASLRTEWDSIAARYDIIITPSAVDEAPEGLSDTGTAIFCSMWTILHAPAINVPGFNGAKGLPIGLTVVGGRYTDIEVLRAAKAVGEVLNRHGVQVPR